MARYLLITTFEPGVVDSPMEEWQPDSLAQFADAYLLVPFDGRSDESLKATWTGAEPYGLGKVQMAGTTNPAQ